MIVWVCVHIPDVALSVPVIVQPGYETRCIPICRRSFPTSIRPEKIRFVTVHQLIQFWHWLSLQYKRIPFRFKEVTPYKYILHTIYNLWMWYILMLSWLEIIAGPHTDLKLSDDDCYIGLSSLWLQQNVSIFDFQIFLRKRQHKHFFWSCLLIDRIQ